MNISKQLYTTFDKHGIDINTPKVNLPKMMARKQEVISQTCDGVQYLMDKNKIKVFHGMGSFKDKNIVNIDGEKKEVSMEKNNYSYWV